jgi:predicted ester cyclase
MLEEYKASDLQYVEEVWHLGNAPVFEDIFQTDYEHNKHASRDAHQAFIAAYRGAFPDVHFTIEDHFVAGDRTVMRWTGRGTHSGELNGLVPTGKEVTITGILISRYADGKVVEQWSEFDELGLLKQLGVVSLPA